MIEAKYFSRIFWLLLGVGGFWALLVYNLAFQWSLYPQYSYGWSVPFLCGLLFFRRFISRPEPDSAKVKTNFFLGFLAANFSLALWVQEANLIWRLTSWLMAMETVAITLLVIYRMGGKSWVKHFSFPVVFFLIAVPWLRPIEEPLIKELTKLTIGATVEGLNFLGIPALQKGSVLETSNGLVGIEEACSGVRSFQASLMITLFLGELFRLLTKGRILLIASGLGIAFVCNILRTLLLVYISATHGLAAMNKWHDSTGVSILLFCFLGTWALGEFLKSKMEKKSSPLPKIISIGAIQLSPAICLSLAAWLFVSEIFVQYWYRSLGQPTSVQQWSVHLPENKAAKKFELGKEIEHRLKYDEGQALGWRESDQTQWQMLYFFWQPAETHFQRIIVQDGKNHGPESCLSAIGKNLRRNQGMKLIQFSHGTLPFERYVFDDNGQTLHVFFCTWQKRLGGWTDADFKNYYSKSPRLVSVLRGNRSAGEGLQILELAVWGIENDEDAEAALIRQLDQLVNFSKP